jgi:hypothetical protein
MEVKKWVLSVNMFKRNGACNRPCLLTSRTLSFKFCAWLGFLFCLHLVLFWSWWMVLLMHCVLDLDPIALNCILWCIDCLWYELIFHMIKSRMHLYLYWSLQMKCWMGYIYFIICRSFAALINHLVCPYTDSLLSLASTCALQCFSLFRACLDPWGLKFSPLSHWMFGC